MATKTQPRTIESVSAELVAAGARLTELQEALGALADKRAALVAGRPELARAAHVHGDAAARAQLAKVNADITDLESAVEGHKAEFDSVTARQHDLAAELAALEAAEQDAQIVALEAQRFAQRVEVVAAIDALADALITLTNIQRELDQLRQARGVTVNDYRTSVARPLSAILRGRLRFAELNGLEHVTPREVLQAEATVAGQEWPIGAPVSMAAEQPVLAAPAAGYALAPDGVFEHPDFKGRPAPDEVYEFGDVAPH